MVVLGHYKLKNKLTDRTLNQVLKIYRDKQPESHHTQFWTSIITIILNEYQSPNSYAKQFATEENMSLMTDTMRSKVPQSKQDAFVSAALIMKNVVDLLKAASDKEKEILVFTVYFFNIASKKSSDQSGLLLIYYLRDILTPSLFKKIQSSVKKFKEAHVRDPVAEELIDKVIKDMEPS